MPHKKLLIIAPLPRAYQARLAARFPDVTVVDCVQSRERVAEEIRDAHYVFGRLSREEFLKAEHLEFMQVWTQGVESVLYPELVGSPVIVANGKGIWSPAIAEHVLALILALYRCLSDLLRFQRQKQWVQTGLPLDRLSGKTVCFLGTGDIAQHTVALLRGFECPITGFNRTGFRPSGFDRVASGRDLYPLLGEADVVVCTLPLTADTRRLVDAAAFEAMKPTALFINVGRGKTVDEPALIDALRQGRIAGAGLDVLEQEPPAADNPLWDMPNVLITSHIGGLDKDHPERAYQLLAENLERLRDGRPLKNVVDKQRGY